MARPQMVGGRASSLTHVMPGPALSPPTVIDKEGGGSVC